jgi:hypothetical protein
MGARIREPRGGADEDHVVANLHLRRQHVIGEEIEGASAAQIEARVMPMTSEDAVFDAAAIKRKAHMRAAVVEGEDAFPIINHQDRGMTTMQHKPTLGF